MNNTIRYDEIDILRGIAIFFVLLGHAIIVFPVNLHDIYWCNILYRFISLVHMPLFFLISGFCYKEIKKQDYPNYIFKKIKRLAVPYLVFCFIDIFPRVFLPHLMNRPLSLSHGLYNIAFKGGEFWFLYTLFSIFLIFPCIQKAVSKNKIIQILLFVVFLVLHLFNVEPTIFLANKLCKYLFWFYCGYLIKTYFKEISEFYQKRIKKIHPLLYITAFLGWTGISVFSNISDVNVTESIFGIFFLTFAVIEYPNKIFDMFKPLGKVSLQLYLLNGSFLLLSRNLAINILHIQDALSIILINMLITTVLSYFVITRILNKLKTTRILTGTV